MPRILNVFIAILTTGLFFFAPVSAQSDEVRVNQLIVYGEDPCPQSSDDEITVCARKDEGERYRIPEPLRTSPSPENDAWNNRVIAYETIGKTGTLSCTPTGAGGWTGCVNQMIETAYAEKESDPSLRFNELIAEERARRLATIDTDAAEEQARVEQAEREYFEERGEQADTSGNTVPVDGP